MRCLIPHLSMYDDAVTVIQQITATTFSVANKPTTLFTSVARVRRQENSPNDRVPMFIQFFLIMGYQNRGRQGGPLTLRFDRSRGLFRRRMFKFAGDKFKFCSTMNHIRTLTSPCKQNKALCNFMLWFPTLFFSWIFTGWLNYWPVMILGCSLTDWIAPWICIGFPKIRWVEMSCTMQSFKPCFPARRIRVGEIMTHIYRVFYALVKKTFIFVTEKSLFRSK